MEKLRNDELHQILDKVNLWIGNCDAKTTAILCLLIFVLFAKTDPKEFVRPGVKNESLVFFSSIAKHKNALDYRRKLRECTPEQMQEDLISQIYICSLICDQKFDLYNSGVKSLIAGLIMYFLIFLVGQMLVP